MSIERQIDEYANYLSEQADMGSASNHLTQTDRFALSYLQKQVSS